MFNIALVVRIVVLSLAASERAPLLLPPERVIERDDLKAPNCTSALINASNPDATPANPAEHTTIDPDEAANIGDAVLAAHYDAAPRAVTSAPFLMRAPLHSTERLVWGRLWLPADHAGTYEDSKAAIVYVDAIAAAPLFLYTNITVWEPLTGDGCIVPPPPPDRRAQLAQAAPLVLGVSLMLIGVGAVLDYRRRVLA